MNKKGFKEWLTDEDNLKRWKKYLTESLQEKDFVSFFNLSSLFFWLNKTSQNPSSRRISSVLTLYNITLCRQNCRSIRHIGLVPIEPGLQA